MKIEDGTGKGYLCKVNDDNKIETRSTIIKEFEDITIKTGQSFAFASGFINLTATSTEHGFFYIKNNSNQIFHFVSLRTCGTAGQFWKVYKNPTSGTLLTSGTVVDSQSTNFSSGAIFDGQLIVGADSLTVTDGDPIGNWIQGTFHHSTQELNYILNPGNSVALTVEVDAAAKCCCLCLGFMS